MKLYTDIVTDYLAGRSLAAHAQEWFFTQPGYCFQEPDGSDAQKAAVMQVYEQVLRTVETSGLGRAVSGLAGHSARCGDSADRGLSAAQRRGGAEKPRRGGYRRSGHGPVGPVSGRRTGGARGA